MQLSAIESIHRFHEKLFSSKKCAIENVEFRLTEKFKSVLRGHASRTTAGSEFGVICQVSHLKATSGNVVGKSF